VQPVYRVHRQRGGGGSLVHRGPATVQVAHIARVVRAAGSGHDCLPRGLQEEKGVEGNLTEVGSGRHGNGARPAMSFNGGGSTHPMHGD
jgi:hypothetical protein